MLLKIRYHISAQGLIMNWYIEALKKSVVFYGRATRSEFWYFMLFYVLALFVAGYMDTLIVDNTYGVITIIVWLSHLLPVISVSVRRLHDTGRSGWWYLVTFIPVVGIFIFLILAMFDSDGDNFYGPNLKLA